MANNLVAVGLSGGLAGTFTVQVTLPESNGDNIVTTAGVDQFKYECTITSVSPSSGSYNGGTLITITGNNFSPAYSDTLVYVGDTLNWFCNIETITSTQITCRTPRISSEYDPGTPQRVVISTKLYSFSTCPGNSCNFTYINNDTSPKLNTLSASTAAGGVNITLTGTNFIASSSCSVSLAWATNSSLVYTAPALECTANNSRFTVPRNVPSGNYLVRIRNEIGESNGLNLRVTWSMGTPNYNGGGSLAGNIVTFSGGAGYPTSLGNGYNVLLQGSTGANLPVNIVSCCSNNVLQLALPPAVNGTVVNIVFKGPVTTTNIRYIYQQTLTPVINYPPANPLSPGVSTTVTFTRTDTLSITSVNITRLQLVSTIDSARITDVPTFSVDTTTKIYTFTASLPSGSYNILALTPNGYCQVNNPINVSLDNAVSATTQTTAFTGGLFTVTGNNLSPSSFITVNNFRGTINSYTSSSVTYNVPPFVTANTQSAFKIAQPALLDGRNFVLSSDQAANVTNVTAAFDGIINTIYGSASPVCWIGVDVGQGLQAQIDRVRFFPFLNWDNTVNYTLGAVFEGSNDQSSWTLLATFDQTVHSGWNVIRSVSSAPFRYIRFRHTSQSQCNLAEIQLYGIVFSNQTPSLSSQASTITYNDGLNTRSFNNAAVFTSAATPTVTEVVPPYGDIFGGYTIAIKGTNLGFGPANVLIDNVPCANPTSTGT